MKNILDKITYHAVYDDSILGGLRYALANGFAGLQVAVEAPHLSFENLDEDDRRQIAEFCAANRLSVSLHASETNTSLFEASRHLLGGMLNYFQALFEFGEKIGSRLVTFHVGRMPTFPTAPRPGRTASQIDLAHFQRALDANLRRLAELGDGRFVLCFENIGLTPIVIDVLQPHLDSGELALCWDLAKMADDERVQAFMWSNIGRVRQVHLHDVHGGYAHQVIGTGTLDLLHFLPRLAEAEALEYCVEVRPREKAAESVANLKRLIENHEPRC